MMLNSKVIVGAQASSFFELDRKECFAWGFSQVYDNVRAANLKCVRHDNPMSWTDVSNSLD